MTDHELLLQFSQKRSQEAFAEIVHRHIHWLHSAALRQVRDEALAQDVTQAVFLVLIRKGESLPGSRPLAPWLFRVLRYVAANALRDESRRKNHEREAAAMQPDIAQAPGASDWADIAPLLDGAVESLSSADRSAVLLRFYQQKSLSDVGQSLGISEEAARKRISRALEKLRAYFADAGKGKSPAPAASLGAMLLDHTTRAAPAPIVSTAVGVSAAAPISAVALSQGALTMLFYAQLKFIAACAVVILGAGLLSVPIVHAFAPRTPPAAPPPAPAPELASAPAVSPADAERNTRAALARGLPAGPARNAQALADARARFIAVELFARRPAEEQSKNLAGFFRDFGFTSPIDFGESTLNSIPDNILKRNLAGIPAGDNDTRWNAQLTTAAATMTPEQLADAVAGNPPNARWLDIAATVRTQYILLQNRKDLVPLVLASLDSSDADAFKTAAMTTRRLSLTECTEPLVAAYLKADAQARSTGSETSQLGDAHSALLFSDDPAILRILVPIVEKDPKLLIRFADLFDGPLMTRPAEPALLKFLESPDADIREAASRALSDCPDPILAGPIGKLAQDPDQRLRHRALSMAEHLPDGAFSAARPDLLPFLSSTDDQFRIEAITCFAAHKDPAAAPPLLAFLRRDKMEMSVSNTLLLSLNKLCGGTIHYDQFHWGPVNQVNTRAIDQLDAWIQSHTSAP